VNILVVPTNSAARLAEFLRAWAPWPWDRIVVVQDAPALSLAIPPELEAAAAARLEAYSWAEIDALVPDPSIVSREDSAIRSFGFWRAWLAGAEVVFTLDDDCFPSGDGFVARHRDNLFATPVWTSSVPGMRVRGLPYRNRGVLRDVHVSVGLWRGSPDVDAVTTLARGDEVPRLVAAPPRVVSGDQLFPMSGMNLAFRREAACLMYFPPMGRGRPFRRFDDIWCGLVVQRICRHLRYPIVCGEPMIDHQRASDAFVNLVKEAPGIAANEDVWETVAALPLTAERPLDCVREVGAGLAAEADPYLAEWGRCLGLWADLFAG
jgi:hypothetical protein